MSEHDEYLGEDVIEESPISDQLVEELNSTIQDITSIELTEEDKQEIITFLENFLANKKN